ncbi:MAG: hypothetical protein J7K63_02590, partial [Candidatus Marinimicrobia bacterium]|nr:hypothetical protein [Candidatus Neomarinimicrobiota bacterium]
NKANPGLQSGGTKPTPDFSPGEQSQPRTSVRGNKANPGLQSGGNKEKPTPNFSPEGTKKSA